MWDKLIFTHKTAMSIVKCIASSDLNNWDLKPFMFVVIWIFHFCPSRNVICYSIKLIFKILHDEISMPGLRNKLLVRNTLLNGISGLHGNLWEWIATNVFNSELCHLWISDGLHCQSTVKNGIEIYEANLIFMPSPASLEGSGNQCLFSHHNKSHHTSKTIFQQGLIIVD